MDYLELLGDANKIYDNLVDEESRDIFRIRLEYMFEHMAHLPNNEVELNYYKNMSQLYSCGIWGDLEHALKEHSINKIVVYGCGWGGQVVKIMLDICGHPADFFVDGDISKQGGGTYAKSRYFPQIM